MKLIKREIDRITPPKRAFFGQRVVSINPRYTMTLKLANDINAYADVWFTEHEYPFLKSVRVII